MAEENGPYFLKISQQDKKHKLFMWSLWKQTFNHHKNFKCSLKFVSVIASVVDYQRCQNNYKDWTGFEDQWGQTFEEETMVIGNVFVADIKP